MRRRPAMPRRLRCAVAAQLGLGGLGVVELWIAREHGGAHVPLGVVSLVAAVGLLLRSPLGRVRAVALAWVHVLLGVLGAAVAAAGAAVGVSWLGAGTVLPGWSVVGLALAYVATSLSLLHVLADPDVVRFVSPREARRRRREAVAAMIGHATLAQLTRVSRS